MTDRDHAINEEWAAVWVRVDDLRRALGRDTRVSLDCGVDLITRGPRIDDSEPLDRSDLTMLLAWVTEMLDRQIREEVDHGL